MKSPQEWFKQAEYDLETARYMFDGERYFYAVFMCHLAVEKALKGVHTIQLNQLPPKTHNLIYLVEKINLPLPEHLYMFIRQLNGVSVPTRYPDDLNFLKRVIPTLKPICF